MFSLIIKIVIQYRRHLIFSLLVLVISGCGFQLRGSLNLYEDISPLYLQQNNASELARDLKLLLATNKIMVVNKTNQSNSQLLLLNEETSRRVLTVDGDGRAKEYLLTYTVYFSIKIKTASAKVITDSISLSRSLLFNTDAVLAVSNESEVLYKDMKHNAARLILLKLQAHAGANLKASSAAKNSQVVRKAQ